MAEMTLREVCRIIGVSRRAVQGYEKAKLVSATNRTSSGYLLYDDSARERIRRIKLFQEMGFSIKEIQIIIDGPSEVVKSALLERKAQLNTDINHASTMIIIIQEMLEAL